MKRTLTALVFSAFTLLSCSHFSKPAFNDTSCGPKKQHFGYSEEKGGIYFDNLSTKREKALYHVAHADFLVNEDECDDHVAYLNRGGDKSKLIKLRFSDDFKTVTTADVSNPYVPVEDGSKVGALYRSAMGWDK